MSNDKQSPAFCPSVGGENGKPKTADVTMESLAALKHLPASELSDYGCRERKHNGRPAVAIPYFDANGQTQAVRYRTALHKKPNGADDRFRWRSGDKATHLYGQDRLGMAREAGWVLIVEGESDCWTAWHYGIPAVGVPGKGNWTPSMADRLTGVEQVYVWQEPDAEDFSERIGRDLPDVLVIVAPEGVKDISDAHVDGKDVPALLDRLRATALPLSEILARKREDRVPELREAASPVLDHPDPLTLYRDAIVAQGYGGDIDPPTVILLAATGRVLGMRPGTMPVHLLILGPASAGKSYALYVVRSLLPGGGEAYHQIDAGSPRTLIYDDAPLDHRVAIFGESDSLPAGEDNPAASAIRNLLQDHYLHYDVVVRDPETGDFTVRHVSKPGPTTLVTTSTRRLGSQLDTRVFTLEVPDDQGQTAQALLMQAKLEKDGGAPGADAALLAYQGYLQALAPWDVVVPFADDLSQHLASQPMETRVVRDYARLLSLIKAVTILRHQHRQRDDDGRWIATPDDYAEVFRLVCEVYKASNSGCGSRVRAVVKAVENITRNGPCVFARQTDIAKALNLRAAAVSRRVGSAKRGGWLVDHRSHDNQPSMLRVGEPLPPEYGLPDPANLVFPFSRLTDGKNARDCSEGVAPEPDRPPATGPTSQLSMT